MLNKKNPKTGDQKANEENAVPGVMLMSFPRRAGPWATAIGTRDLLSETAILLEHRTQTRT